MALWRMGNGSYVKVADMSDEHVRNALRMLRQSEADNPYRDASRSAWINRFEAELEKRPEPLF